MDPLKLILWDEIHDYGYAKVSATTDLTANMALVKKKIY